MAADFHLGFFGQENYIRMLSETKEKKKIQADGRGARIPALTLQTATEHVCWRTLV